MRPARQTDRQATATTRCRALSFNMHAIPACRRLRARGVLMPALPSPRLQRINAVTALPWPLGI